MREGSEREWRKREGSGSGEMWEGDRVRGGEGGEREWRKWEGRGSGEMWEGNRVSSSGGGERECWKPGKGSE